MRLAAAPYLRLPALAALLSLVVLACSGASGHAATSSLVGSQSLYQNVDSNSAGVAEAFRTTASSSGAVGSLSLYVDSGSTAKSLVVGLYANNAGHPGALLGSG